MSVKVVKGMLKNKWSAEERPEDTALVDQTRPASLDRCDDVANRSEDFVTDNFNRKKQKVKCLRLTLSPSFDSLSIPVLEQNSPIFCAAKLSQLEFDFLIKTDYFRPTKMCLLSLSS